MLLQAGAWALCLLVRFFVPFRHRHNIAIASLLPCGVQGLGDPNAAV
jgi:hypothetical protein